MTLSEPVEYFDSVPSTQDLGRSRLSGVYWTTEQTAGRGRYDGGWHAPRGSSLAMTFALRSYRGFTSPQFIGMWMGLCLAQCFDLRIQWPNDLVLNGRKVAGILAEIVDDVPIVGIGLNLGPMSFPDEIAMRATSLVGEGRPAIEPASAFSRFHSALLAWPEVPLAWSSIMPVWDRYDSTKDKVFRTSDGVMGMALGLSEDGELLMDVGGEVRRVSVAEALWGS